MKSPLATCRNLVGFGGFHYLLSTTVTTRFYFYFLFLIQNICITHNLLKYKTDLHSGTTICRKANIWYIPHNMNLVHQSITSIHICSGKHKPK